jgi:GMP synthase (glutamine-hydrolysing)
MTLKVLVVDGNTMAVNAAHTALEGTATGDHYAAMLLAEQPDLQCTIIHPASDLSADLPPGVSLRDFDGVAWSGSALNIYNREPAVTVQIDLCRAVFAAGVPLFGSCWGLQVATVAAGGVVRRNPKGKEIGFGRRILPVGDGADHPMFAGRRGGFDAITIHTDEVETLPPGMRILASNPISTVQAADMQVGDCLFWGVQYHPEYTLTEIAVCFRRYADSLVAEGLFPDHTALQTYAAGLETLDADRSRRDLAWLYGIDETVTDDSLRRAELRNWLSGPVRDHAARR